jgi:O-antigen/teichoic acid export membrane protein
MATGIFVLIDSFAPLYLGSEFAASATPVRMLLPGVICFAVTKPIYSIGQAKGELQNLIAATLMSSLINIVLNIALIPRLGMVGASIATSIGYGTMILFHSISAHRIGFRPLSEIKMKRISAAVLVFFSIVFFVDIHIHSDVLSLLTVPIVGVICFPVIAVLFDLVKVEEISKLFKMFI